MAVLWIDLETAPPQELRIRELIRAGIKPGANLVKPEVIAEDINKREAKALAGAPLDGLYGEIFAIAFAWEEEEVRVLVRNVKVPEREFLKGSMERIAELFPLTPPPGRLPVTFGGWNTPFDVRFFWKRCVLNGLVAPWIWPMAKRYPEYNDGLELWKGRSNDMGKLGHVGSIALGLNKISDSELLWQEWLKEQYDLILDHARRDLEMSRDLWERMREA